MNSRVRRKKFLFYLMTTTVDAELHFKIEPEVVVVVLQKIVSLSLYFIMLVMVISRFFSHF